MKENFDNIDSMKNILDTENLLVNDGDYTRVGKDSRNFYVADTPQLLYQK